jgi:hypothetical protein
MVRAITAPVMPWLKPVIKDILLGCGGGFADLVGNFF